MATVKYRIGRESKNEIQITAIFTCSRVKRYFIPTDQKVIPKNWNKKSQEVKSYDPDYLLKNKRLSEIKSILLDLWDRYRNSPEMFATIARSVGGASTEVQKKTLVKPIYESFLKSVKADLDEKTHRKHKTTFGKVMAFNENICFEDFDIDWFGEFRKSIKNLRTNKETSVMDCTIQKDLKNLKRFLGWASDRVTILATWKKWSIVSAEPTPFPLHHEELLQIEAYTPIQRGLLIARDYLSASCRSGARISNLKEFNINRIEGNNLKYLMRKGMNSRTVRISLPINQPYTAPIVAILKRWGRSMPSISEKELNENIKTLLDKVGITREIEVPERRNGKTEVKLYRICDYASIHTGRATFITYCAENNVPHHLIMQWTGITDYRTLKHYLGGVQDSKSEEYLGKMAG